MQNPETELSIRRRFKPQASDLQTQSHFPAPDPWFPDFSFKFASGENLTSETRDKTEISIDDHVCYHDRIRDPPSDFDLFFIKSIHIPLFFLILVSHHHRSLHHCTFGRNRHGIWLKHTEKRQIVPKLLVAQEANRESFATCERRACTKRTCPQIW